MNRASAFRIAAPILMALALNGCVAAAIPALAGATLARKELRGDDKAPEAAPVAQATPVAEIPPVTPTPTPAPDPVPVPGPMKLETSSTLGDNAYSSIIGFVQYQLASQRDAKDPRLSAILSNPSKLDGKRRACTSDKLAILIDLDPYKGSIAPEQAQWIEPPIAKGLQSLRDKGVVIAWISAGTAAQAGDIRAALKRTGLDPEARDRLILMRYRGDRKQTRRDDLAKEMCLIAIAGDHRADFDELYDYLVKPEAAQLLEPIIGNGWFLVPPVLGRK